MTQAAGQVAARRHDLCLAPLRGVTGRDYRNLHAAWFGAPDRAVAPFIASVAGARIRPALLRDIDPGLGQAVPLVPQVLGRDPAQLRILLRAFRDLGYACADLNAGCPWPLVARKGRGAGLLRDASALARMLEAGCEELPGGFSVKVRLGINDPDLLASRLPVLNAFPLREVAIHARTAAQMFSGRPRLDAFETAAAGCRHPVVYNGDILTRRDFLWLKTRLPGVSRWMIGRGLAADPFLFERLRAEEEPPPREAARLKGFLDAYLAVCRETLPGPAAALGRLKELWLYLRDGLNQGARAWETLKLCRTLEEYERVTEKLFDPFSGFVADETRAAFTSAQAAESGSPGNG